MVTPYKLGPYEEVWEDDCSSCPAHVEFDSSATAVCQRKFVDDGVCYRGDWAADNDWFGYHFEFPPEWGHGDGKVDFTYEFKYWAIGDWENGVDYGGAMYCTPTQDMAIEEQCTDDFDDKRDSDNTCDNWNLWTSSGGDFDAYARFEAANNGGNDLACFQTQTYSHTGWTDTTLKVGFWVWDDNVDGYGLTGGISNEAWAVSHFKITFTPPPFTSTTETPTTTTETPTTTTETPTSTTKTPTTTTETPTSTTETPSSTTKTPTTTTVTPTTTTETPTSTTEKPTTTKGPTTTTLPPTSTETPTTTVEPTATDASMTTTLLPTTTGKPTTSTLKPVTSTEKPTTTSMFLFPTTTQMSSTTLKPETTVKPTTTLKPTTLKPTTLKPTTTVQMATTEFLTTLLPIFSTGKQETTEEVIPESGSGGGGAGILLFAAIGGGAFALVLLCLFVVLRVRRKRKEKKRNAPRLEVEEYQQHVKRCLSNSEVGIDGGVDVEMAEKRRGTFDWLKEADKDVDFKPGSRRVSNLMRNSPVLLAPGAAEQMKRGSLLLMPKGGGPLIPRFPPPAPGMRPAAPVLPQQQIEDDERAWTWQPGEGSALYDEYEDLGPEGGGHQVTGDAAQHLEGRGELKEIFMRMKIEARTAEEKSVAKKLDLALEMEPEKMEQEFQALVQMGVDTGRITELLLDKADNVLLAHRYRE